MSIFYLFLGFKTASKAITAPEFLVLEVTTEYQSLWDIHHVDDAVNIYLVNNATRNGDGILGNSPPINLPYNNSIVIGANSIPERTSPHELGHYFGLVHTDQGTQIVNLPACYSGVEYYCSLPLLCGSIPNCANIFCLIEGDGICDTPADPGSTTCGDCNTTCTATDPFGNIYAPDKQNIMSLYNCQPEHFSPEQQSSMWDCLNNHPARTFLLTANPTCEPIAAEMGKVVRACQSSGGLQLDDFPLVKVDMTNSNWGSTVTRYTQSLYNGNGSPNPLAGQYHFNQSLAWAYAGEDVTITCKPKNDDPTVFAFDPLNGVTSLYLSILLNHINGSNPMQNKPYGWIAGDVRIDGKLDLFDWVALRSVILGFQQGFEGGSWRYVPSYYLTDSQFAADFAANPFQAVWHNRPYKPIPALPPYPPNNQKSYMDYVEVSMQDYAVEEESTWSFRAVKSGDLNCSADIITTLVPPDDDPEVEAVPYPHDCFDANEEAVVLFKASGALDISAFQLGLSYDETAIEVLGVDEGEVPSFALSNFNVGDGKLRTIWIDETGNTPFDMASPKTLFKAYVRFLRRSCDITQIIIVNDSLLSNRFFDEDGISQMMDLTMQVEASSELSHTLNNVYPNPFGSSISFNFTLTAPESVSVKLTDVYGNVQTSGGIYGQGSYTHNFQPSSVFQNGLIYYQVMLGSKIFTGSIVKMQ